MLDSDRTGAAHVGVVGLAVMGSNLARNFASHGRTVALYNRTQARTDALVASFVPAASVEEFTASLERPRRVLMMVKAGGPTDGTIDTLVPHLEPGDILVDGGNAHYKDTRRREAALRERGLHFVGAGISGGEEGALHGTSIMPGGSRDSYGALGPLLEEISAKYDGEPCCAYMGPDGAGHFVKMVHNGIEYADMQFIAEAYDLLRTAGLEPARIAEVFREWNTGDLDSFLIEITAEVLGQVDAATGRPFVDVVADAAEQKGTGRWTVQTALELGVPTNAITEAVFARSTSGHTGCGRRPARPCPARKGDRSTTPSSSSRTSGRRCGPPSWSPTPRAWTSSGRPARPTTGASTWPRWPGSGGPAASSGPACWSASVRPTPTPTSARCWLTPGSPPSSGRPRTAGAGRSRWPRRPVWRSPGAPRRWPTTTPSAASGSRQRWCRGCETSSGRTPTGAWTAMGSSTRSGPRTEASRRSEGRCRIRAW